MKRFFRLTAVALAVMTLFASCLKGNDDDTVVTYNDKAITSFTLATLNRYVHTTAADGSDSVYVTTVAGAGYKFSIDQLQHYICNLDSLPMGTDVRHVPCTITTLNQGALVIESLNSDSLFYLSTGTQTDSLDFSEPRHLRVYASDGSGYTVYTVQLNVHQEDGDTFSWQQRAESDPMLAQQTDLRVVTNGNRVFVAGTDGSTTTLFGTDDDGKTWHVLTPDFNTPLAAEAYRNITVAAGYLYLLTDGQLMRSDDGEHWTPLGTPGLTQLMGACPTELYAKGTTGEMMMSADGGATWQTDELDADAALLPTEDVAIMTRPYTTNKGIDYVLMAGNRSQTDYPDDRGAQLWCKTVDRTETGVQTPWSHMEVAENNVGLYLPRVSHLSLISYDNSIFALGNKGGAAVVYESKDGGLTWNADTTFEIPEALTGAEPLSVAVDDSQFVWMVQATTGQVWRGRLNRLGWE